MTDEGEGPTALLIVGGGGRVQKASITLLDTSVLEKEKLNMSDERSRKWQITQNNPSEHGFSHEFVHIAMSWLKPVYYCMCDETGEEGTPHTHLYVQCENAIHFSKLKSVFPSAHIEKAYGTPQENREYVRKEGKYADSEKKTTNHIETFEEWGDLPEEKQGRRTDNEDILQMIKDGHSELAIIEKHPHFMNNLASYDKVRSLIQREEANKWRDVEVVYIYGETEAGKTRYVTDLCGGYDSYYRVTDYDHPFDEYDGQDTIVFDEFRGDIPMSHMLNYLDGHPVDLPCRYHNKKALWTRVFIISNIPLSSQYRAEPYDTETAKAFERRIGKVLHFRKGQEPEEEKVQFV